MYARTHTKYCGYWSVCIYLYLNVCISLDKFTYLGSSVASTEKDIDTRLTKAWTAINRLSIIWKSDMTDKMNRSFFQAAVTSILLYGCTTWTLTKRLEKKLDSNYTRMLRAILNKSWRQHLPPITKTIQVRRTRHDGHCWRSRDELIGIVAVCKFELVVLLLHGHMWGSIGVHHLWARPCFSSSVPRVWFV